MIGKLFEHRSQKYFTTLIYIRIIVHSILKTENKSTSNINNSNNTYDEKDIDKINLLLGKARILQDKITLGSINKKEKRDFTTIINKLFKLNYFDYELCEELLN